MARRGGVKIVLNRFPEIAEALREGARKNNLASADLVAETAKDNAAKDSGSMAAAIYVASSEGSDYADAVGAAKDLNPDVEIVAEVVPPTEDAAVVSVAVAHGKFVEFGTENMAAQPFLRPAADGKRTKHVEGMQKVIDEL